METRELRLILTQRCNYNCVFCHKEGLIDIEEEKLNSDDYQFLFFVAKKYFQIQEVTLTGGEPLIRKDIEEIIKKLALVEGKLTLTSNGALLSKILNSGNFLNRINISLHSLDVDLYESVVRQKNTLENLKTNLFKFRERYPLVDIRLNSTLLKKQNTQKDQILTYIDFAKQLNASIKYVELFPKETPGFFSIEEMTRLLQELDFKTTSVDNRKIDLTNNITNIRLSQIFCAYAENIGDPCKQCKIYNDLFITPAGDIKPCRSNKRKINILNEVKTRDIDNLVGKISLSISCLGEDCIYAGEILNV